MENGGRRIERAINVRPKVQDTVLCPFTSVTSSLRRSQACESLIPSVLVPRPLINDFLPPCYFVTPVTWFGDDAVRRLCYFVRQHL